MHNWYLIIRKLVSKFLQQPYIKANNSVIPPPHKRWCGSRFLDDGYFIRSAEREARRVVEELGCNSSTPIADIGCGPGRLAIGLLRTLPDVRYLGLDVHEPSIKWCQQFIGIPHPNFRFEHLRVQNDRYNQDGEVIDYSFTLPIESDSMEIVYLYSVFSHMPEVEMKIYLQQIRRILRNKGKLFFTAFVEKDVPNISINPPDYKVRISGPLHVVRYNYGYLQAILESYGFTLYKVDFGVETDGQSGLYLID